MVAPHGFRFVCPLLAGVALAPWHAALAQEPPLVLIEASSGLGQPAMEGGRTEFEFADIDGDGFVDLLSIGDHGSPFFNSEQAGVMVWFGDGQGTWSHYQTGHFGYGGIAIGDVNGDGLWDVAYGMHHNYSGQPFGDQLLEVALGNGTGRAWTPWDTGLATAGETWGMFSTDLADVDNDGWLDVGSLSFGCCAGLHVYRNNADGTWSHSFGFLGGNSAMEFYFGDFDGDGDADFAASHGAGTVYLGDGSGGFTLADGNLGGSSFRSGLSIGDVDGDGRDDIAWSAAGGLQVWRLGEGGQWQDLSANLASLGQTFHRTQIADLTLDGRGELIALRPTKLVAFRRAEDGQWVQIVDQDLPAACSSAAALRTGTDATHNGRPDILVVTRENCGLFGVGGRNRPRFFANGPAPAQPGLHPVFPRGGETLLAGEVRFVRWHAAIPENQRAPLPRVSIELSTAGAAGPWIPVAADLPASGRYQWRLPADLPASEQAHLRLTLASDPPAVAITPAPFRIAAAGLQPPQITAAQPETVPAVHPDGGLTVTLTGSGFASVTAVQVGGVELGAPGAGFEVASDGELSFPSPKVDALGLVPVVVTSPAGSAEIPLTYVPNSSAVLAVAHSLPALLPAGADLEVTAGAPLGDWVYLLGSPSLAPSLLPGFVQLAIGAGFTDLFLLASLAISPQSGWAQWVVPAPGLPVGLVFHFQAARLPSTGDLPLEASNVRSIQVGP